jgi:hypothetical protein
MRKEILRNMEQTADFNSNNIISLGITGHRKLPSGHAAEILSSIDSCLQFLKACAKNTVPKSIKYCMISLLAEGADRVAAFSALKNGFLLKSLLPFPRDIYIQDFFSAPSREEFSLLLQKSDSIRELTFHGSVKEMAYYSAGKLMLEHIDILMAVWDGNESTKHGGTASIVALAKEMSIPILWINPEKPELIQLVNRGICDANWRESVKTIFQSFPTKKVALNF